MKFGSFLTIRCFNAKIGKYFKVLMRVCHGGTKQALDAAIKRFNRSRACFVPPSRVAHFQ
jgi:hypothetical protein